MNIPFYRHVRYEDDGVERYQCLYCNKFISVRGYQFSPIYCCYCGIEYIGAMVPKKREYINLPVSQKLIFVIQEAFVDESCKDLTIEWKYKWKTKSPKEAIIEKRRCEDEERDFQERCNWLGHHIYRIITEKESFHPNSVCLDIVKYFLRTGKNFAIEEYERRK